MKTDVAIALGVAAFLVLRRSRVVPWGDGKLWTVPIPDMMVRTTGVLYPARISSGFAPTRGHYGSDFMYARRVAGDQPSHPPGTHDGSPMFFAPSGTPVIAARDGVLWSADHSARGWQVVLDHGKPFATYYQHLDRIVLPEAAGGKVKATGGRYQVRAGDVIGFMGFDPTDAEGLRHLHFEVWCNGAGNSASVDPAADISAWNRATWTV